MASEIQVQTISGPPTGANANKILLGSGQQIVAEAGGLVAPGQVIQVVSATKTDTQTTSAQAWIDITGLSVSITPKSSNNKILVFVHATGSGDNRYNAIRVVRNGTPVGIGDTAGSRTPVLSGFGQNPDATNSVYVLFSTSGSFVDTPSSTSTLTYKVQFGATNSAAVANINKIAYTPGDDANWSLRGISSITVQEIAA